MLIVDRYQYAANKQDRTTGNHEYCKKDPTRFDEWVYALMPKVIDSAREQDRRDSGNRKINEKCQTENKSKCFHSSGSLSTFKITRDHSIA